MSLCFLKRVDEATFALYDPAQQHVGNFKRIQGQWKFKAIGYGPEGQVMPGHGPLTAWHNTCLAHLDEAKIHAQFFQA